MTSEWQFSYNAHPAEGCPPPLNDNIGWVRFENIPYIIHEVAGLLYSIAPDKLHMQEVACDRK